MAPTEIVDNLYVADIRDVQTLALDVDRVVGICQDNASDNVSCKYSFYNLSDGEPVGRNPGEFKYEIFEEAVDEVREALDAGESVIVHCHAGQSRSVSVAACVLAADHGYSLDGAYWHLRTKRDTSVSDGLRFLASMYMNRL